VTPRRACGTRATVFVMKVGHFARPGS
jgi:hypothetical protein